MSLAPSLHFQWEVQGKCVGTQNLKANNLDSNPSSTINWLCDGEQVISSLCASVTSSVKWRKYEYLPHRVAKRI